MKKSKNDCDLKSCFFCNTCSKEWLPAIEANKQTFEFRKGELIFKEGEPVKGIFFLYEGKAKIHKKWGNDKELIIRIANKGAVVGHRGLGHHSVYPVSGTALEHVTACYIDLEFFESTLKVNPIFTYELLLFFADELQESENRMRNLAHMPVKGRVAQALLTLKNKFGLTRDGFIDINLSRQDLASFTGTTYETIFRIMSDLSDEKIILLEQKSIRLLNEEKLLTIITESAN